jgi:hypothetical protein
VLLAYGDISRNPGNATNTSASNAPHWKKIHMESIRSGRQIEFDLFINARIDLQAPPQARNQAMSLFAVHELLHMLPNDLVSRLFHQPFDRRIDFDKTERRIRCNFQQKERVGHIVEDFPVALFACTQRHLGRLARANVEHDAMPQDTAVRLSLRHGARLYPELAP